MRAFSIEELRQAAKRRLPRAVFDFIDGGAEDERTLRGNREAFERARFLRKVLVDVSSVDTGTTILGSASKLPIVIAPTGAVGFGWRGGDVAVARAAAAFGIPFTLSTSATASIERIAQEAPGRHWFQAYFFKDREYCMGLIERARRAGYDTLMVTRRPAGGWQAASAISVTISPSRSASRRGTCSISPRALPGRWTCFCAACRSSRTSAACWTTMRTPAISCPRSGATRMRRSIGKSSNACAASGPAS